MNKSKVPDTCARLPCSLKTSSEKKLEWFCGRLGSWRAPDHIPCRPGRLPLPLKDCPRRKA